MTRTGLLMTDALRTALTDAVTQHARAFGEPNGFLASERRTLDALRDCPTGYELTVSDDFEPNDVDADALGIDPDDLEALAATRTNDELIMDAVSFFDLDELAGFRP